MPGIDVLFTAYFAVVVVVVVVVVFVVVVVTFMCVASSSVVDTIGNCCTFDSILRLHSYNTLHRKI